MFIKPTMCTFNCEQFWAHIERGSDRGPLIQEIIIPDGQNFESQGESTGMFFKNLKHTGPVLPGRFRPKMLVPKPLILNMISFIMELS